VGEMDEEIEVTSKQKEVLDFVACNEKMAYQRKIANYIGKSESAASKRLNTLIDNELIRVKSEDSNPKFYEATKLGFKVLVQEKKSQGSTSTYNLRVNKAQVKIPIVEGHEEVESDDVEFLELRNNYQILGEVDHYEYGEVSYRTVGQSLYVNVPELVYPPTVKGVTLAYDEACEIAEYVKSRLEDRHDDLKFGRARPEFADIHYALENNIFALALENLGSTGAISDGDLRLVVDMSKGYPELEVEGPNQERYAINLVKNVHFQAKTDLEKRFEKIEERIERIEKILSFFSRQSLRNTVETVEKYAKNTVENQISG
jgi:DNA-binding Lrp family transcriptional regulator